MEGQKYMMNKQPKFLLVDASVLPEVFEKVIEVKKLLETGKVKKINDAVHKVGISRSAYYKYKDFVFPFYQMSQGKIITLFFILEDVAGILSNLLNIIAKAKANILTINQNIPINGAANITVSIRTGNMACDIEELVAQMREIEGVKKIDILASE
ncbi:MAG: chorismate mutase [Clostridiales bacterium]|jgi:chorismate mutase|nr:chorismate mutase [Clostridiales bacterium]MDK2933137.1 chorismate mutase [Clostridiales bacterium]